MAETAKLQVRFWGVRGSIACPGTETLRYGGNTSCVEVRCGDELIIFDAGTGLRPLGVALAAEKKPVHAEIICSHTHLDHICGLPFFAPCYGPANSLHLWAGHLRPQTTLRHVFETMLSTPLLPDLMGAFAAKLDFTDFDAGQTISPYPDVIVKSAALNHPGGATGYRLEWNGKAMAYITDTEHRADELDANILGLIDGVDLMIYDATFTEAEYAMHVGWGHSTWQEAVRLADRAGVKTLALYHHDPAHTDEVLDALSIEVTRMRPDTLFAREGLTLSL